MYEHVYVLWNVCTSVIYFHRNLFELYQQKKIFTIEYIARTHFIKIFSYHRKTVIKQCTYDFQNELYIAPKAINTHQKSIQYSHKSTFITEILITKVTR